MWQPATEKGVVSFDTSSYTLPNNFDEEQYVKSTEEEILIKHSRHQVCVEL